MKIVALTAFTVRIPLRRPIRHASHSRTETDNLLVQVQLEDGTLGYGEGVPRDYVTGETIDSTLQLLQQANLPSQLASCKSFSDAVHMAEHITLPVDRADARGIAGNAARCAVEMAILDGYGRYFRRPLSDVTPLLAPEILESRQQVRYSGAITSSRGMKLRMATLLQRLYGLRQLKIKVGIRGQDDVNRLRTVRRCAGNHMDLRIDVNEAWSPAEVVRKIHQLEPFGITSVEQPVPHEQIACLRSVREQIASPIMLDESLCGPIDANRAIQEGLCDLFNIRLSKCGGYIPSLRLVQLARKADLGYQLGCQVGETAILSAAGRHFATSVRGLRYVEGSYDRHLVRESLGVRDITFGFGGLAPALPGGGLGIEIDPAALQRVRRQEVRLL